MYIYVYVCRCTYVYVCMYVNALLSIFEIRFPYLDPMFDSPGWVHSLLVLSIRVLTFPSPLWASFQNPSSLTIVQLGGGYL